MANEETKCAHEKAIPVQVESEEGGWIHWCAACGGLSNESGDIDQPKEPWFLPGEISDEYVERINRAARELE